MVRVIAMPEESPATMWEVPCLNDQQRFKKADSLRTYVSRISNPSGL